MTTESNDKRLDSWKLIARYFGKSERTVRRWEANEGLPVHRHMHSAQGTVFAWESELAEWRRSRAAPSSSLEKADEAQAAGVIVVTPFQYLGGEEANSYLALGFTDEMISDLSRLEGVHVISRTSSYALSGRSLSASEIRKLMKVDYLVEGAVRQSNDRLKVSIQLVDCRQDQSLWSHAVSCGFDEVFDAQASLAQATAQALKQYLNLKDTIDIAVRLKRNRQVWEALARARTEALRWTETSIRNAITLLETSVDEFGADPELVAAVGRYYLFLRETGADMSEQSLNAAQDCLSKLRTSAPKAAETHQLAGWISYQRGETKGAIEALRLAMAERSEDPDTLALLGYCYLLSGLDDLAAPLIRKLLIIDPLTPLNHSLQACFDLFAGRFEKAVERYAYMRDLDPSNKLAHLFHVMALALTGDSVLVQRAVEAVADAPEASPVDRLLHAFASAVGEKEIRPIQHIDDIIRGSTVDMFPRLMAQAHGLAGDQEAAQEWLSIASQCGFKNYPFIAKHDPSFATFQDDPGFKALADHIKQDWSELRRQFID